MGGFACFAAAIFLFFCVVYWLWFSLWKREGVGWLFGFRSGRGRGWGGSQLKSAVASPLVVCSVD